MQEQSNKDRRIKVLFAFGTRPEAIKLAPVIRELRSHSGKFTVIVCVTAQHRQMLDQVLNLFDIKPDYDLNIMKNNQSLFDVTTKGLLGIKKVLEKEKPDILLVQGDTTTTFVASLSAFYLKIPIGHVEAGLRTNDKYQPFPEEINRRLTTHIADLHFAPTEKAKQNLLSEGISENKIFVTGNTVIDALLYILEKQKSARYKDYLERCFLNNYGINFDGQQIILVTGHRRENFGEGFENICYALKEIAEKNEDVIIIYPVHLNPNVQKPVYQILGSNSIPKSRDKSHATGQANSRNSKNPRNIYLIDPLDYEAFVYLMSKSYLILTDSGGIQEEAPSLGKPVLVMRSLTERPEAVDAGTVKIVGTDQSKIIQETKLLLDNHKEYEKMARAINPYGDGKAAKRIVDILEASY